MFFIIHGDSDSDGRKYTNKVLGQCQLPCLFAQVRYVVVLAIILIEIMTVIRYSKDGK
jgi:hypothetical protein